jgi:hypothetical protein
MLEAIARYGVLSSEQIWRLDSGSRQKVTRILQSLAEDKLVRRTSGPLAFVGSFFDSRPLAFAITHKGLRILELAGMPLNVTPKKVNIPLAHELECAEDMFSVVAAVARHGGVRLIDQPELVSHFPAATHAMERPVRLLATADPDDFPHLDAILKKTITFGVIPDRLFALALPDNTGWSFALERDRGTEDITARRIKGRATFFRKVLGYTAIWHRGQHIKQFGAMCKTMRVLVTTTSEMRIKNMIDTQEHVGAPPGLFLYSTRERIEREGALGPAWKSAKRDCISLLDRG